MALFAANVVVGSAAKLRIETWVETRLRGLILLLGGGNV